MSSDSSRIEGISNLLTPTMLELFSAFKTKNPLEDLVVMAMHGCHNGNIFIDFFEEKKASSELIHYKTIPVFLDSLGNESFIPTVYSLDKDEDDNFKVQVEHVCFEIDLKDDVKILILSKPYFNIANLYNSCIIAEKKNLEVVGNFSIEWFKYLTKRSEYKNKCIYFARDRHGNLVERIMKRTEMTMEDIILDKKIEIKIKNNIVNYLDKIELYKKYGVNSNIGIFLTGAPGNGKTTLCKILRDTYKNYTFFWVMSMAVRTSDDINAIYMKARDFSPSIVLWEDVGPHVRSRQKGDISRGDENILDEFLQQLCGPFDNAGVITLMTSNLGLEEIDEAILRPGRVGYHIEFPKPSDEAIIKYTKMVLDKIQHDVKDNDLKVLEGKDFSFAKIGEIFDCAKRFAVDKGSYDESEEKLNITSEVFKDAVEFVIDMGERITDERAGFRKGNSETSQDVREGPSNIGVISKA